MSQYITELQVSLTPAEEKALQDQGFTKIHVNLNQGAGGNCIYLWFKKGQSDPITRIQCSFIEEMCQGLNDAGFDKIDKNLNAGTHGDTIYLWFYRGSSEYDVPIVDLHVTTDVKDEAQKFRAGWERLACDLNRNAGGNWIHLFVKREKPTYICDVTATDEFGKDAETFQKGFIRVDEDTNRGAGGDRVFIWYRQTTVKKGLTDLQISINDEYKTIKSQNYKLVNVDLNQKTGGEQVYLWFKKDDPRDPIRVMSVITNTAAVAPFQSAGVHVIKKNLNFDNNGCVENLCYYP